MQDAHEHERTGVNMPTPRRDDLPTNERANLILRAREAGSIRTHDHAERIAQSAGGASLLHAVHARLHALAAFGFYPSLESFYAADRRRRHSRERDFGLMWRGARGATYRAAWVQETGELYVFMHGHPTDGGGTVDVLARRFGLGELHAVLFGYADVCGRPGSLTWLIDRAADQPGTAAAA
jgi:hypothetical protein